MNILILIILCIIFWIMWRMYSNRHTMPCPFWLSWMIELDNPFAKAHKANEIIQMLPLKTGIKILDIGCGPGRVLLPLAQKIEPLKGHITGLDIQPEMLEKTRLKAQALHLINIDFIHANIKNAPLNNLYDIVLMVCIIGEIPTHDRLSTMQKVASYLKPDGIISITETIFDPHFQSYKSVSDIMNTLGFIKEKYTGNRCAYTAHFKRKLYE